MLSAERRVELVARSSFSLAAMSRTLTQLVDAFALDPPATPPRPLAEQIGGVARGAAPCLLPYRRR